MRHLQDYSRFTSYTYLIQISDINSYEVAVSRAIKTYYGRSRDFRKMEDCISKLYSKNVFGGLFHSAKGNVSMSLKDRPLSGRLSKMWSHQTVSAALEVHRLQRRFREDEKRRHFRTIRVWSVYNILHLKTV